MTTAYEQLIEQLRNPNLPVIIEETNQVGGEIFAFLGMGTEGNGTSTTVYELSRRLAEAAPDKDILLLDFNISEPELEDLVLDPKTRSNLNLDQVYNQANTGKISGRDVASRTLLVKGFTNLYLITGTKLNYLADHFDTDVMRPLLQAARQEYDYIFVDAPAHFDNAATVATVLESDVLTFVTDYSPSGLRLFAQLKHAIYDTDPGIAAKIRLLGIDRQSSARVSVDIIQEVLELKFTGHIANMANQDEYYNTLDTFLQKLELETPRSSKPIQKKRLGFRLPWQKKRR